MRPGGWQPDEPFSHTVTESVFFDVEADFWLRRFGRRRGRVEDSHNALKDLDDSCFVDVEARFEFRLQRGQLAG